MGLHPGLLIDSSTLFAVMTVLQFRYPGWLVIHSFNECISSRSEDMEASGELLCINRKVNFTLLSGNLNSHKYLMRWVRQKASLTQIIELRQHPMKRNNINNGYFNY